MKLESMKPGMILYDRHKTRAGADPRRLGEWPIVVKEVHADHIVASPYFDMF